MQKNIYIAIFCLLFFAQSAIAQDEKLFNATSFTLDNGLEVIAIPNPRAPVVTHMVWYKTGAADEPHGQSGVAHYIEHLMFKGSENVAPGALSKTIRDLGGNDNAFTSQDYTAYFQTLSSQYLEKAMSMEADRMKGLKIPEDEAASELLVVLEERRQRLENDPQALFFAELRAALFPAHPYGTPIIGWKSDVENLTLKDALDYFKVHYKPNNARLIVAGDITPNKLRRLAEKYYGDIDAQKTPKRIIDRAIDPLITNTTINMQHSRILQPIYARLYHAPNWQQDQKSSLALTVLQELLDGGSSAPLYQEMVVKQKLVASASINYSGQSLGPNDISFSATPAANVDPKIVKEAFETFLIQYSQRDWTPAEVRQAVTRIQDRTAYLRDSVTGPAMIIGQALATGMTLNDIEHYPHLLNQVTPNDIKSVFNKYLSPKSLYIEGFLMPETLPTSVVEAIQEQPTAKKKEK
jgi:zinc protease